MPSPTPLQPGFMLLQGNKLEELRDLLSQWLTKHPLQPLENEHILVQSNGIAQWLKMALARQEGGSGIAAAIQVNLPGRFIWQAYRSIFANLPKISPYDKAPLTWRLYALLNNWPQLEAKLTQLGEDPSRLKPLASFLAQDNHPRRLHQLAANLADLYDQYQVYRADWLAAWQRGEDVLIKATGVKEALADKQTWQASLWRLLLNEITHDPKLPNTANNPWAKASRAQIHQAVIEACQTFSPSQRPAQLPRRVVVFGISSLPRQTLDLLHALAPFTQILVFASNPSHHYWGDLIEGKELLKREYQRSSKRKIASNLNPEELHLAGNPLLASWGKQGRDYLHLLDEQDQPATYRDLFNTIDIYSSPLVEGSPPRLLNQLQDDIYELRSLAERQSLASKINPAEDTSLEFISAHSPLREVEILHDQLLHAFTQAKATGQALAPREVLVMVPDINHYAPAIQAVFGRYANKYTNKTGKNDPRFLPFHITDQSQRQQNTLLLALEKLLQLPSLRFSVNELLHLLATPALRARYQITEADLPKLTDWITGANIRWGLNGQQKTHLGLPAQEQNTWLFGLRRLVLGFASGDAPAWQGIEAYSEVGGLEAALLGPLAQLLHDLTHYLQLLQTNKTPTQWLVILQELLQKFFTATSSADTWALTNLETQLENLSQHWHYASFSEEPLPLAVIAEEVLASLDQPSLSQKFLGGSINFATLMPMRAIPFEQVWLLGMNDGDYPRSVAPTDFDLMAQDYRPGDRSRREDDRYLFLEALLAARQKLVISWVGKSQRDNTARPPSVVVSQLRDYLAAGWQLAEGEGEGEGEGGEQLLAALTQEHPLQAFSSAYFLQAANLSQQSLFTYAHEWQALASHQLANPAPASQPLVNLPFWLPDADLTLNQLNTFLRCPLDALYRQRLEIYPNEDFTLPEEVESFAFDGLQKWHLTQQLINTTFKAGISAEQHQQEVDAQLAKLTRQGVFIDGAFGSLLSQQVSQPLPEMFAAWQEKLSGLSPLAALTGQLPVAIHSPQQIAEVTLSLHCPNLYSDKANNQEITQLLVQASAALEGQSKSTYRWRNITLAWLTHLAAQALSQQPVTSYLITAKGEVSFAPLAQEKAQAHLTQLVGYWAQALQAPLPLALNAAVNYLYNSPEITQHAKAHAHKSQEELLALQVAATQRGYLADLTNTPYLGQYFASAEELIATANFNQLVEAIYQPLISAIKNN